MDYKYNEDYLDEDDDGVMYSTRNYCSESDDDELAFNFLSKKKKRTLNKDKQKKNDSEDEFEKDMSAELLLTMQKLTAPFLSSTSTGQSEIKKKSTEGEFYDDVYFDSDDSEDDDDESDMKSESKKKSKQKRRVMTNDELFYDPNMDDEDEAWVNRKRRSYQPHNSRLSKDKNSMKPLPQSDAVLNCPACFTPLCLDCQRHEIYKDQYRAMFVFNCKVDNCEVLHVTKKENKRRRKKKSNDVTNDLNTAKPNVIQDDSNINTSHNGSNELGDKINSEDVTEQSITLDEDHFHPVRCTICNTKVAVYDKDEAYYYQRQADTQEHIGKFEASLESRHQALLYLHEVLQIVKCPIVRKTIKLQIKHENKKIELLKCKSCQINQLIKTLENHPLMMARAKAQSLALDINPKDYVTLSSNEPCNKMAEYSFKFLQNAEKIESVLNEVEDKLSKINLDKNTEEKVETTPSCLEVIMPAIVSLKEHNIDNIKFIRNFEKELAHIKAENSNLKMKVKTLESQLESYGVTASSQPISDSSTSPFIIYPPGKSNVSPEISIPEFPPLDCPPLDFLPLSNETEEYKDS